MTYFTVNRTLALINMSIVLILVADIFLLPSVHLQEKYDRRYSTDRASAASGNLPRRVTVDYIVAVSGDEFRVADAWRYTNLGLNEGDTFYADKSLLLRQPIALYFRRGGGYGKMPVSFLNGGWWGPLLFIFIAIVSLPQFLQVQVIKNDNTNTGLIVLGTFSLVVFLSAFFFQ